MLAKVKIKGDVRSIFLQWNMHFNLMIRKNLTIFLIKCIAWLLPVYIVEINRQDPLFFFNIKLFFIFKKIFLGRQQIVMIF